MTLALPRILLAASIAMAAGRGRPQPLDVNTLRSFAGLTEDEWQEVERGEVVGKILETHEGREVAVLGVSRVRASATCFVEKLRDIESFKRSSAVLRIRKFGQPVLPEDLEPLTLDPRDVSALETCRLGDCKVKLPPGMLVRPGGEEERSSEHSAAYIQSLFRERLLQYIQTYQVEGNSALIEYHDKSKPVRLADEFRGLLDAQPGLAGLAPEFHRYLARYPRATLAGVEEFFYGSTEDFGFKPVTSVTHEIIYSQPGQALIVSKQIYASHYFDGSLALTIVLDDPEAPGSMYLMYLNRSRLDILGGMLGGLRRFFLQGRLKDGLKKTLREVVRRVNTWCAPGLAGPLLPVEQGERRHYADRVEHYAARPRHAFEQGFGGDPEDRGR
jgi:hypothetical protein